MIGSSLSELLKETKMSQKDVAKKFNLSTSAVNKWVMGISEPDLQTLCKLADYFQVSTDYLLGRTGCTEVYSENARLRVENCEIRVIMDMRELTKLNRKEVTNFIKAKKQVQQYNPS